MNLQVGYVIVIRNSSGLMVRDVESFKGPDACVKADKLIRKLNKYEPLPAGQYYDLTIFKYQEASMKHGTGYIAKIADALRDEWEDRKAEFTYEDFNRIDMDLAAEEFYEYRLISMEFNDKEIREVLDYLAYNQEYV